MHSTLTWPVSSLIVLAVAMGFWLPPCRAEASAAARSSQDQADEAVRDFPPVLGRGPTQKDAQREALRKAQELIVKHLRSLEPPVESTPSLKFVRDHLLGKPEEVPSQREVVDGVVVKCWSWPLAINAKSWQAIQESDRKERMERRMLLLGKLLAGLVALLGVVAGYVRLDEWTKGYYTGRLRLAALAALAIVGGGLWLLA